MSPLQALLVTGFLVKGLSLADTDWKQCIQSESIATIQEFTRYAEECHIYLQDISKRLPMNADADYLGCFEELKSGYTLYSAFNSTMLTIEECIWKCREVFLSYAGIKNGNQCLCALSKDDLMQVKDRKCLTECPVDFRFYCGGKNAMQIYETKPLKSVGEHIVINGNYTGCFHDSELHLLSGNTTLLSNMTINYCVKLCHTFKSYYAGLARTNLCLCGNDTIKKNASLNVHCKLRCKGNITQHCGGLHYIQLYRTQIQMPTRIPKWYRIASYLGCFSKRKNDHLLLVMKLFSAMTLEWCLSTCEQFGIRYSGVQGKMCFCGASFPGKNKVSDYNCDQSCPGNEMQFCGSHTSDYELFLQIYETKDPVQFFSSEGMFIGCFFGKITDLKQMKSISDAKYLSIDSCLKHCYNKGLKFAGIENGFHCACGQVHDNLIKTSDAECNITCPGNSKQVCGGKQKIQMHGTKIFPGRFTPYGIYIGCFHSISTEMNRFPLLSTSMTLNICLKHCWDRGLLFAALNRGVKCFCGKTSSRISLRRPDFKCSVNCGFKDGNFCGGIQEFQIYHVEYLLRKVFGQGSISLPSDLTWN